MAYNAENEKRETLLDITKNKRGDVIRVSAITDAKNELHYDIRNMYVTENGELGFTSKGIRIKNSDIGDIIVAIMNNMNTDDYNNIIDKLSKNDQ